MVELYLFMYHNLILDISKDITYTLNVLLSQSYLTTHTYHPDIPDHRNNQPKGLAHIPIVLGYISESMVLPVLNNDNCVHGIIHLCQSVPLCLSFLSALLFLLIIPCMY